MGSSNKRLISFHGKLSSVLRQVLGNKKQFEIQFLKLFMVSFYVQLLLCDSNLLTLINGQKIKSSVKD